MYILFYKNEVQGGFSTCEALERYVDSEICEHTKEEWGTMWRCEARSIPNTHIKIIGTEHYTFTHLRMFDY